MSTETRPGLDGSRVAPRMDGSDTGESDHLVQFYEDDAFLLDAVSRFIGTGLTAGHAGIVIATKPHRDGLAERLRARGVDVTAAREQGTYVPLDAAETLSKFMVDGWPDERRFANVVGGVVARAAGGRSARRVRIFGEMVALLWAEGNPEAAIRLEDLWNGLAKIHSFSLLCAYPMGAFGREADGNHFRDICTEHSQLIPAENYMALTSPDERLRAIARLQQKANALERETAERKELQKSLERRENELSDFLENAVVGLHRVGPDGTILWANKAELDLLGYTAEEYIGHHIAEFHAHPAVVDDVLARLLRGETLYDYPAQLRCKDGSLKDVLIHSNALCEDGKFIHTRCFTRDVTERKRLEEKLKESLSRLSEADRRKDEFLAMLSHELRNPLGAISSAVAVLGKLDQPDEKAARARSVIARQAGHLTRLVDDLLDVARLEAGKIVLDQRPVDLKQVAEQALLALHQTGRTREHDVSLYGEPVPVVGDPLRLEQVVANLLDNALKYTPPGGKIAVTVERDRQQAILRVRDSGVGIAPDMLRRIFDLFVQLDQSVDRSRGGLGLGLTLVKRLVERHGGTVSASSAGVDAGSEFVVQLPLRLDAGPGAEPVLPVAPRVEPRRVVLVEDHADARASLRILLEMWGHHVVEAEDGLRGCELILSSPPDVAFIDVGLPGRDGYAVAQAIRAHPEGRSIYLVALTGYGQQEDRRRAYEAGFDAHLVKPVDHDALLRLLTQPGPANRR